MLVLSRKREETIVIPDLNVTFKVLAVHAGKVKIGIEAPEDAVIMRGELLDARPIGPVCVLPERDSSGQDPDGMSIGFEQGRIKKL